MKIRFGESFDETQIKEIHEQDHQSQFLLPKQRLFTIVAENEKVDAAVIVRLLPEATLVLRTNLPKKVKAKALDYLIQASIMLLRNQNYHDAIAFTNYEGFPKILQKHYGFQKIDAAALLLNLE